MNHSSRLKYLQYMLGVIFGGIGIALFVYASYSNPIKQSETPAASAAATSYNTQWLLTQVRAIEVFRPATPATGPFSPAQPEIVFGAIDTGPKQWQVRTCIGANFATPGDYASLGTCPSGVATATETWTVSNWGFPNNLGQVGGGKIPFRARGIDRARSAIPASNNVRVDMGQGYGGENRGWAFRSGLYGIMFATDDDGVSANGKGKWWAYSELPLKWTVSGTITTP